MLEGDVEHEDGAEHGDDEGAADAVTDWREWSDHVIRKMRQLALTVFTAVQQLPIVVLIGVEQTLGKGKVNYRINRLLDKYLNCRNKPIQDGGDADAPLSLNRD